MYSSSTSEGMPHPMVVKFHGEVTESERHTVSTTSGSMSVSGGSGSGYVATVHTQVGYMTVTLGGKQIICTMNLRGTGGAPLKPGFHVTVWGKVTSWAVGDNLPSAVAVKRYICDETGERRSSAEINLKAVMGVLIVLLFIGCFATIEVGPVPSAPLGVLAILLTALTYWYMRGNKHPEKFTRLQDYVDIMSRAPSVPISNPPKVAAPPVTNGNPNKKYCSSCGTLINKDAAFCEKCGAHLT